MRILRSALVTIIALICFFPVNTWASGAVTLHSPDNKLKVVLDVDAAQHLTIAASYNQVAVVTPSPIGIILDGADTGLNVSLGTVKTSPVDEDYPVLGVHATAHNHGLNNIVSVTRNGETWQLEARIYNDGFAYRFIVPKTGPHIINGESSSWILPADATIWYQNDLGSYEGVYTETTVGAIKPGTPVAFPATLRLAQNGPFVTLTEANLINYSDMALEMADKGTLTAFFHADAKGWTNSGDVLSPWRVAIITPDLNSLVNSDIVHNLCPPPSAELASGATWIMPGRSSWQWWSSGGPRYADQHQWLDWTKQLGFEYYLIDEGWSGWKSPEGDDKWVCLKKTVDYAAAHGVKVFIWLAYRDVPNDEMRMDFFNHAKASGVVGLKIDFPPAGSVKVINWYEDCLREAAALHLMIDFHGAVKPTGRDRTWPNEINREGIRGHEYHISRYHRIQSPNHDTILPFTRYIAGHADYTPTVFEPKELLGFTWSRELAQAVVFTSPFLCYADSPKYYLANPACDVLEAIPSTWDETVVLPGSEIGQIVGFARRKGDSWFIGVMNGGNPRSMDISLSFLGDNKYKIVKIEDVPGKDADLKRNESDVSKADKIHLDLTPKGGFVGWLTVQK